MRKGAGVASLTVMLLLMLAGTAFAQSRSVFWREWNVTIDAVDTATNFFHVAEDYDVEFTGSFRFGSRVIELTNLDRIENVRVYEDGRLLQQSCSQREGTYCAQPSSEGLSITYYFENPISNGRQQFTIEYDVIGALRIYEGGDQLWWAAIPDEHFGFGIGASTVTVDLPAGYAPREGVDPVVTYGAPTNVTVNGTRVLAKSTRQIGGQENLEIRVQFPHDPDARPAGWQDDYDRTRAFEENVQPIINVVILGVSLLLGIGGPLALYARWQKKGRDPNIGPVPTYLTEPPSALPPGVFGSLLDEKADVRDVMSTIVDLARRGYVVIEETQTEGLFGIGRSSAFTFKRTDKPVDDLRPFEQRMVTSIFSGNSLERSLASLKNKFYTVIPQVQDELYDELVSEALFDAKPSTTRAMWSAGGGALVVLGVAGVFIAAPVGINFNISPMLACIPMALGVTGVVAFIVGQAMPAKTRKGAEEAAKWGAFLEYLRNLEKYQDVKDAAVHFDDYLPYAVAFGLDRTWMQKFRGVENMPIPPWYYPTYMGGPYGRGYMAGSPVYRGGGSSMTGQGGLPGEIARADGGGFSMEQMSTNMAASMESLSTGLTTMMESATRAMTSRPQQASSGSSGSWSSGGSSWSGGGFSGGGSSGGGSSGFG